jgi:hypothetical protein
MYSAFSSLLKTVNETLYGSTKAYWGAPLADPSNGTNTPRFDQLILSIHNRFLLLQRQQDPRCASFTGLTPGTFLCLVKSFTFVRDFSTPLITPRNIDISVAAYYSALSMPYEHISASGWNMPLLTDDGLTRWIQLQLWTHPSLTLVALNSFLSHTDMPLVDSSTGKPFLYASILEECLPAAREDAKGLMDNRLAEWTDFLQSQDLRLRQMQLQQRQNVQMMGLASQGANLAAQQAWNMQVNTAGMSWGQF